MVNEYIIETGDRLNAVVNGAINSTKHYCYKVVVTPLLKGKGKNTIFLGAEFNLVLEEIHDSSIFRNEEVKTVNILNKSYQVTYNRLIVDLSKLKSCATAQAHIDAYLYAQYGLVYYKGEMTVVYIPYKEGINQWLLSNKQPLEKGLFVASYNGKRSHCISSNSAMKECRVTYLQDGTDTDIDPFGTIKQIKRLTRNGYLEFSKELKKDLSVRLSAQAVPMVLTKGDLINSVCIILDKDACTDGIGLMATRVVAKGFKNLDPKSEILHKDLVGRQIQCRPFNFKLDCQIGDGINNIIENLEQSTSKGVLRLVRDEITPEFEIELNRLFCKWAVKSTYFDKYCAIVISDNADDETDLITNLNAVKVPWNYKLRSGVNLLKIHHNSESHVNTGVQTLDKLAFIEGKNFYEGMKDVVKNGVHNVWNDLTQKVRVPALKDSFDFEDRFDNVKLLAMLSNKESLVNNPMALKLVLSSFYKSVTADVNKMKFSVKGLRGVVVPDYGYSWFGKKILNVSDEGIIEVFSPEVSAGTKTMFTRNPAVSLFESGLGVFVGIEEIKKRIDALDVSEDAKKTVLKYYEDCKDGVIVVPAVEIILGLFGGMDFDADTIAAVTDENIVKMFEKGHKKMVSINSDLVKSNKIKKIDADYFQLAAYAVKHTAGIKSVGSVTEDLNKFKFALLTGQDDDLIRSVFGNGERKHEYVSPLKPYMDHGIKTYRITVGQYNAVIEQAKVCLLTDQSLRDLVYDLNIIIKFIQEIIIDATKHDDSLDISWMYNLSEVEVLKDTFSFGEVMVDSKKKLQTSITPAVLNDKKSLAIKSPFNDVLKIVEEEMVDIISEINAMYKESYSAYKEMISEFIGVIPDEDIDRFMKSLKGFAELIKMATSVYSANAAVDKTSYGALYGRMMDAISNNIRMMAYDCGIKTTERLVRVLVKSINHIGGIYNLQKVLNTENMLIGLKGTTVNFCGAELAEETFEDVMVVDDKTKFAGRRLKNGEYEVFDFNGKQYAGRKIEDLFLTPEGHDRLMVQLAFKDAEVEINDNALVSFKMAGSALYVVVNGEQKAMVNYGNCIEFKRFIADKIGVVSSLETYTNKEGQKVALLNLRDVSSISKIKSSEQTNEATSAI